MKKRLMILGAIFIVFTSFTFSGSNKQVNFIDNDYKAAKEASKEQNKPIFVFIYTSHCNMSSKMNDEVFSRADVAAEMNNKFICVMLDADATLNNIRITAWGTSTTPTYVFLDKNRDLALMHKGYTEAPDFIKLAEEALKKY